jgi:hypothetical protein
MNRQILLFLAVTLALLAAGCGGDDDKTPFGSKDDVRDYRRLINPIVDEMSAIELEVLVVVDDEGISIDSRLNAVFIDVLPRLQRLRERLDQVRPPRKLQMLHEEITQMVQLRLDGAQILIDGFAAGDVSVYPTALEARQQADELIPEINDVLCEIDVALGDRDDCRLLAADGRINVPLG